MRSRETMGWGRGRAKKSRGLGWPPERPSGSRSTTPRPPSHSQTQTVGQAQLYLWAGLGWREAIRVFQEQVVDDQQQMQVWKEDVDTEVHIKSNDPKTRHKHNRKGHQKPQNIMLVRHHLFPAHHSFAVELCLGRGKPEGALIEVRAGLQRKWNLLLVLTSRLQDPFTEATITINFLCVFPEIFYAQHKHINAHIPHTPYYPHMMPYIVLLLTFLPSLSKWFMLTHRDLPLFLLMLA